MQKVLKMHFSRLASFANQLTQIYTHSNTRHQLQNASSKDIVALGHPARQLRPVVLCQSGECRRINEQLLSWALLVCTVVQQNFSPILLRKHFEAFTENQLAALPGVTAVRARPCWCVDASGWVSECLQMFFFPSFSIFLFFFFFHFNSRFISSGTWPAYVPSDSFRRCNDELRTYETGGGTIQHEILLISYGIKLFSSASCCCCCCFFAES